MKTSLEHIEKIVEILQNEGFHVYYKKLNDIMNGNYIYVVEQRRKPIIKEDMVDKAYMSIIEIDYITNAIPINFINLYQIRDKILNILESNGYNIIEQLFEIGDTQGIIRILIQVIVK